MKAMLGSLALVLCSCIASVSGVCAQDTLEVFRLAPCDATRFYNASLRDLTSVSGADPADLRWRTTDPLPAGLELVERQGIILGTLQGHTEPAWTTTVEVSLAGKPGVLAHYRIVIPIPPAVVVVRRHSGADGQVRLVAAREGAAAGPDDRASSVAATARPVPESAASEAGPADEASDPTELLVTVTGPEVLKGIHVELRSSDDGNTIVRETDESGLATFPPLKAGDYTVQASNTATYYSETERVTVVAGSSATYLLPLRRLPNGGTRFRAIVGFEQAGASSAEAQQKFFFNFFLSQPLTRGDRRDPLGSRWRAWGDVRVTSVPQQIDASVKDFAINFADEAGKVKVSEVAQAMDFLTGIEFRIAELDDLFRSPDDDDTSRYTLSLIAAGGASTPVTPREELQLFEVNAALLNRYPVLRDPTPDDGVDDAAKFVAFTPADRDRFFRQWYVGVRLKTDYFGVLGQPSKRASGQLDLTWGKNEAVTGGRFSQGSVFRADGFFPFPIVKKLSFVHFFGTAIMRFTRAKVEDPIFARRITDSSAFDMALFGPNVTFITTPQINRDYYRIGVGIDFVSLVEAFKKPAAEK